MVLPCLCVCDIHHSFWYILANHKTSASHRKNCIQQVMLSRQVSHPCRQVREVTDGSKSNTGVNVGSILTSDGPLYAEIAQCVANAGGALGRLLRATSGSCKAFDLSAVVSGAETWVVLDRNCGPYNTSWASTCWAAVRRGLPLKPLASLLRLQHKMSGIQTSPH